MITSALLLFGQAVTPAAAQEAEAEATCNKPVYMVVEGRTFDRQRMGEYALAIAQSGIYQKLGGYYVNNPRPLAVFEGDVPSDYVNLTVRFPCFENAKAFWNSRVYQEEIIKIRQNPKAGDYTVTIYEEIPVRADLEGKVESGRFLANFSEHGIPQVDQTQAEEQN